MSRTTSFGPSVSIRPSNLARAVNVNTPKPSPIKRAVNVNTPAPMEAYRQALEAVQPTSNSPAAAMQTIRDKICAVWPNDPICKLTNQTPAKRIAKVRSKVKNMVKPVTSSIPTYPPVTKPYPAASSIQDIRDKICAENPEACKPYPINKRGLPIPAKKLQSKYCKDHPDSELCKIGDRPVKTLPVTKPTPVAKPIADHIQEIRDKICNDRPELCEFVKQTPTPTSFANREEILKRTAEVRKYCVEHPDTQVCKSAAEVRKYCVEHPDTQVCKIILNQPASPASEQPNNEPGTPANTNPPANVPDSSASG